MTSSNPACIQKKQSLLICLLVTVDCMDCLCLLLVGSWLLIVSFSPFYYL